MEERPLRSKEPYHLLFEHHPLPLWVFDAETFSFLAVNDAAVRHYGYAREAFLSITLKEIYLPEDLPAFQRHHAANMSKRRTENDRANVGEWRHRKKDGTIMTVEMIQTPLLFNGREAWLAVAREMTEQKQTEVALRESNERLSIQYNMFPLPTFTWKREGEDFILIDHNKAAEDFTNGAIVHLLGKTASALYADMPEIVEAFSQCDRQKATVRWEGVYRMRSTGEKKYIIATYAHISPGLIMVHAEDLTEKKEIEDRFRTLVDTAQEGVWLIDPEGKTIYVNRRMGEMLGYTTEEMLGRSLFDFIDQENHAEAARNLERWRQGINEQHDFRFQRKDGTSLWTLISTNSVYGWNGERIGFLGMLTDITARKEAEEALKAHAVRQEGVSELGKQALGGADLSLLFNEAMRLVVNILEVAYSTLLERLDEKTLLVLAGRGWKEGVIGSATVSPGKGDPFISGRPVMIEDLQRETEFQNSDLLREHEIISGIHIPIQGRRGPYGLLGAYTKKRRTFHREDINFLQAVAHILATAIDRKQAEEKIQFQAYHDALTGLPNRLLFEDRLSVALAQAQRSQKMLAVLFIDLDRFKVINDSLGHAVGDRLLIAVGERLTECLRKGDTVGRMGGDEFTVLLPQIDGEELSVHVAERILTSLRPPFLVEGNELYLTASIGIALYPSSGEDAQSLLKHADAALYRAKEKGRDNYQYYSPTMNVRAQERLQLENHLRRALDRGEFLLHYQPQIDLRRGRIVGLEALIRWRRPDVGLIPPAEFIPLAEETGLIVPIGDWVLSTACMQAKEWQALSRHSLSIAVNLSAYQFHRGSLVERVSQILTKSGLPPPLLELELTESILMKKADSINAMLHELNQMGVQLSIDDFGTGYSSLAYLKRFPMNKLKIDQSFIRSITSDPSDAAIARTIIGMAHSLHLKAIAEGVETEAQLQFLRRLECDEVQGYFFSRPLPSEEITKLLAEEKHWELLP